MSTQVKIILFFLSILSSSDSYLKYTEHSCTDLIPKSFNEVTHAETISPSKIVHSKWKRSVTQTQMQTHEKYDTFDQIPFKLRVRQKRYKRDSDIDVRIEGNTNFDGLIIQTRAIPGTTEAYVGSSIGLVGQFRELRKPYKYLTCFDLPYGTVVDRGGGTHVGLLSNVSFVWHTPDHDVGDIRFVASVLRGINYWTLVSSTLMFNPFPISSYSCGSTVACFRVCPSDLNPCLPREALYVFTYHADYLPTGYVEFTIGGQVEHNNSYIAIAFGNEYDNLLQAEMIACHIQHGQAKLKHLLIESLYIEPLEPEYVDTAHPMEVDDYDLDGNMLWCRFRRPMRPDTIINSRLNLYHFHFWGTTDYFHQHFHLPRREFIYSTKFKRNLTTPFNEIISSASIPHLSFGHTFIFLASVVGCLV